MKWLGNGCGGDGDGIVKNEMDRGGGLGGPQRTQDDAAVGYVFQRAPDPEFPPFGPKQLRWAHGDDSIIDNQDKWKYPSLGQGAASSVSPSMQGPKAPTPPTGIPTGAAHYGAALPSSLYDLGHSKPPMPQLPPEQLIYMTPGSHQMTPHGPGGLHHNYLHAMAAVQASQQQTWRHAQQQLHNSVCLNLKFTNSRALMRNET